MQISDRDAQDRGSTSGGFVTVVADRAAVLPIDWRGGRVPLVFAGPLSDGGPVTTVSGDHAGTFLGDAAERMLHGGRSGACLVDQTSLVEVYVPTMTLVVVGGGQVADALADQATLLDWVVEMPADEPGASPRCDASVPVMLSPCRPTIPQWTSPSCRPHCERPSATSAHWGRGLPQARRRQGLLDAGEPPDLLDAIHGPARLDLGANTVAEIALSICAEILARTRAGRAPVSLRDTSGPIHL